MGKETSAKRWQRLARKAGRELEDDIRAGISIEVRISTRETKAGVRRCRIHDKVWHPDLVSVQEAIVASLRKGFDPGLEPWWCPDSRGYHAVHAHGWKSLDRMQQEPSDE